MQLDDPDYGAPDEQALAVSLVNWLVLLGVDVTMLCGQWPEPRSRALGNFHGLSDETWLGAPR